MITNGQIQLYPFLRLALFLMLGTVLGDTCLDTVSPRMWGTACVAVLVVSLALFRHPIGQTTAVFVAITMLGGFRVSIYRHINEQPLPTVAVTYEALLTGEPEVKGKVLRCDLRILRGPVAGRRVKTSILCDTATHRYKMLHAGDGIKACSLLEKPQAYAVAGHHFDYCQWLRIRGYTAQTFIYYKDWEKISLSVHDIPWSERLQLRLAKWRNALTRQFRQYGGDNEAYAVIAAMTLGDKSALSKEIRETYAITGAAHVLALSGLHLGIIYFILSFLFLHGRRRIAGQMVTLCAIWGYAMLVGMGPSIVRAATMMTLYALVSLLNRKRFSLNTLSFAACAMLMVHPLVLWDTGFQLSFMAVLGIILFYRPLYGILCRMGIRRWKVTSWVGSLVSVSLAAQAMTAPIVVWSFGRFSTYFLITNLVAVPLTTVIIYMALAVLALAIWPTAQMWAVKVPFAVTGLLNTLLTGISRWPGASIENIHINRKQTFLLYVLLACICILAKYAAKMYRSAHGPQLKALSKPRQRHQQTVSK